MQDGVLDLYDVNAPQPEGYGGFGRTLPSLLFPNCSKWEHLFERWTTDKHLAPPPYAIMGVAYNTYDDRYRRDPQIGPFMTLDLAKIGGTRYGSAWVRCHMPVYYGLHQEMLMMRGDQISFQVNAWDAERAVVIAQYSQILGSHWIAIIDPYSIPEELRRSPVEKGALA